MRAQYLKQINQSDQPISCHPNQALELLLITSTLNFDSLCINHVTVI